MARPRSVMTDETIDAILQTVEFGLPPDRAARAHGVKASTLRSLRQRDPEFGTALKKAEAVAEAGFFERILNHADKTWTAAAWILERRWPERWSKQEAPQHTDKAEIVEAFQAAARAVQAAGGA